MSAKYDTAITIFSPDGHLFQVEYALEAVRKGATAVAVQGKDAVVLAVERKTVPKLQDPRTARKILKIDDRTYLAFAGLQADARVLCDRVRTFAQTFQLNYGLQPTAQQIARYVASLQFKATIRGGMRPYGLSAFVAGVNQVGKPEMYQTEPNGTCLEWKAAAIGRNSKTVQDYLEKDYKNDGTLLEATHMAIRALLEVTEAASKNMEIAIVAQDGKLSFMDDDAVEKMCKEIDAQKEAAGEKK